MNVTRENWTERDIAQNLIKKWYIFCSTLPDATYYPMV